MNTFHRGECDRCGSVTVAFVNRRCKTPLDCLESLQNHPSCHCPWPLSAGASGWPEGGKATGQWGTRVVQGQLPLPETLAPVLLTLPSPATSLRSPLQMLSVQFMSPVRGCRLRERPGSGQGRGG